jgi:type IV pilus assembly protein PilC
MPIFGQLVMKQALARFCRTFGTLQQSGVPILQAMEVVERTIGNRIVAGAVTMARDRVREGQSMVPPLAASGVFPQMILEMINVGEETGSIDMMLHKVADFYEEDVQRTSERLQAALEPLIIVGLALVVGFIMLAMVLPMFDAITSVGN